MDSADENMVILEEGDRHIRLRCHCENEFTARIRDDKRPTCPECGCAFMNADWEIRYALKRLSQRKLRFYKLRFYSGLKEQTHVIPAYTMWDAISHCGMILSEQLSQFIIDEVSRTEYLEFKVEELKKEREIPKKLSDLLGRLFGE